MAQNHAPSFTLSLVLSRALSRELIFNILIGGASSRQQEPVYVCETEKEREREREREKERESEIFV